MHCHRARDSPLLRRSEEKRTRAQLTIEKAGIDSSENLRPYSIRAKCQPEPTLFYLALFAKAVEEWQTPQRIRPAPIVASEAHYTIICCVVEVSALCLLVHVCEMAIKLSLVKNEAAESFKVHLRCGNCVMTPSLRGCDLLPAANL